MERVFESFARRMGCEIRRSRTHRGVAFIDLESKKLASGYLRLCLDSGDAVTIVEAAVPLASVLPQGADSFATLLALHATASPAQSGKRLFPAIDMANEHLVMSQIVGAETLPDEDALVTLLDTCVETAVNVLARTRLLLQEESLKSLIPGGTAIPKTAGRRIGSLLL